MQVRTDAAFAELTTLRVGGPVKRLVEVDDAAEALAVLGECDAAGEPVLVLGGGSNLLVCDTGPDLTVLGLRSRGLVPVQDGIDVLVTVAAGEVWDDVVARAVDSGWSGIEALAGIPGQVGATPIQNVGAYGQEVSDTVISVDVVDRATGERLTLPAPECGFGYRTSRFKQAPGEYVVLAVTFRLRRSATSAPIRYAELAAALGVAVGDVAPASRVREAVLALRRRKGMVLDPDDHDTWSAGSFFTNPVVDADLAAGLPESAPQFAAGDGRVKLSAAWLIEQAGFGKGAGADVTGGRATLSTKHTLAITNRGTASAADVLALAKAVQEAVAAAFAVTLVPEPTLVGCHL
ncbi:MAG: UDP-N-acetylmuramate dehydrogenase [Actinomycetes bacterium]